MTDSPSSRTPIWRTVLAFILDLVTIFFAAGYAIAAMTGGLTPSGFKLEGGPALMLFAVVIGYFVAGRFVGGPVWKRILGVRCRSRQSA